jgi:ethanolamine ammonia-lyase large subunit
MNRRRFLTNSGCLSVTLMLNPSFAFTSNSTSNIEGVVIDLPLSGESIFDFIIRLKGQFDLTFYRQILAAGNEFKEGDAIAGLAAESETSRLNARTLIANTRLVDLKNNSVYTDKLSQLIDQTTEENQEFQKQTFSEFKTFLLEKSENEIHQIINSLSSDQIAVVVKLMSNDELIRISSKVFNPLPDSQIGSKGYMGARVQPNSPTDNPEDVFWQVMDAFSFAVGDVVLGTNPVSSNPKDVAKIEETLFNIIQTFGLQNTIPHCVLAHIDIQAEVEKEHEGTTGIWFQSIAGTDDANKTFDISVEKMQNHAKSRKGKYGLYAETGQGADETNGHGAGFDLLIHESRKYGFHRALKMQLFAEDQQPWVFVNDVAGFIGPEVFRTKEQLVRCCLEDLVMGKLHGLCIGLDICTTLHMDVSLDDLDWCIDQIMPANPAYLMALPTKNDPMLSYLTTSFSDHVRVREKFGYKVNDAMWDFFKKIEIIHPDGSPTLHFGDPVWVYYQHQKIYGDTRSKETIYAEGNSAIANVRKRGVPIAVGHGKQLWDLEPQLDLEVRALYKDAKYCLWEELSPSFVATIPNVIQLSSISNDRKDYVYHPASGEKLDGSSLKKIQELKQGRSIKKTDVQIVISDGLNVLSLFDNGHLKPYLETLRKDLIHNGFSIAEENLIIHNGRVRAGYQVGELLFGESLPSNNKNILLHIIGERPGSEHRNFSTYITVAKQNEWSKPGFIDHDITRVVSGISDTALVPTRASKEVVSICKALWG